MAKTQFRLDARNLEMGLLSMQERINKSVQMYMVSKASEIEAQMKVNRPWTDRTGAAKQRLTARVSRPKKDLVRITLAHGVDYGIWLEFANDKNYAIIQPTLRKQVPKLIRGIKKIFI